MSYLSKYILIILIVICTFFCITVQGNEYPIRVNTSELSISPNKYAGVVFSDIYYNNSIWGWQHGSGGVVKHPKIILTCAHNLVYDRYKIDKVNGHIIAKQENSWYWKWNQLDRPWQHNNNLIGWIAVTSYGSAVTQYGVNSRYSFASDFAVAWGYEDLAGGDFGGFYEDGESALRSTDDKTIIGYPHGFASDSYMRKHGPWTPNDYALPTQRKKFWSDPLYSHEGFLVAHGIISDTGSSGSPIWSYDGSQWKACGVLVAAEDFFGIVGKTGGLALRTAEWALVDQVIAGLPYTVNFDARGGSVNPTQKIGYLNAEYGTLPNPTRSGYTFDGWWSEPNGAGRRVTSTTTMTTASEHTLYANWLDPTTPSIAITGLTLAPSTVDGFGSFMVSGEAKFNNGNPVQYGTATIDVQGGSTYTATVNAGSFERLCNAPGNNSTSQITRNVTVTVDDGDVTPATATETLRIRGISSSSYDFSTFVAYDLDAGQGWLHPYEKKAFRTTDYEVIFISLFNNVSSSGSVDLISRTFMPDGTQYGSDGIFNGLSLHNGWAWVDFGWLIAGNYMASVPGRYWTETYVDGNLASTDEFVIGWDFTQNFICENIDNNFNPVGQKKLFTPDDIRVMALHHFEYQAQDIEVRTEFWSPNGALEHTEDFVIPASNLGPHDHYRTRRHQASMTIAGTPRANMFGEWTVKFYTKNPRHGHYNIQYTENFRLEDKTAPVASVSRSNTDVIETQSTQINVVASDNTLLEQVVLYWNDGTLKSRTWNSIQHNSLNVHHAIGPFAAGNFVEFWAVATDTSGNTHESERSTFMVIAEEVTAPSIPTGPENLDVNETGTFTVSGGSTTLGSNIEYQFDWGDGNLSAWTFTSLSELVIPYSWQEPGQCDIRARVRSTANTARVSSWTNALHVSISEPVQPPTIIEHPQDVAVTAPTPATFSLSASGEDIVYQWQFSTNSGAKWSNIPNATLATYETGATTTSMDNYRYRCVAINSAGSATSNSSLLTVNPPEVAPSITSHPSNQTVTAPNQASFSVSASGSTPLSYQWQVSNNSGSTWSNISGATSATYNTGPTTIAMNGHRYQCLVSNLVGDQISNQAILFVVAETHGTILIDLGYGTTIPGSTYIAAGPVNLPLPLLPSGSILRSISIDTVLKSSTQHNFASDLAILLHPKQNNTGNDFILAITNGPIKFSANSILGWPPSADQFAVSALIDTKTDADWTASGVIDLADIDIFLGNAYGNALYDGTWSGTITLTYDLVASGSAYDIWAATNAPTGGPGDDFDGDGVPNAVEFVLGGSKDTNDLDKLPTATTNSGNMVFTFVRDKQSIDPSTTVEIEVGTDLTTWPVTYVVGADTASSSADVTVSDNLDGTDTITLSVPHAPNTRIFARLKVDIDWDGTGLAPGSAEFESLVDGKDFSAYIMGQFNRFLRLGREGNWSYSKTGFDTAVLVFTYDDDDNDPLVYREQFDLTFFPQNFATLSYEEYVLGVPQRTGIVGYIDFGSL